MSLFGAMSTAVSGLGSQAAAFTDISDNVANSQTTGFKRVDTAFEDYLTTSDASVNDSGAVVARPEYVNTVQGTVTQTDNPLALAISDQGFFAVSDAGPASSTGQQTFDPQQAYSRDGNFHLDKTGYLVNDAGQFLNGWSVDASGAINRNALAPVQVDQSADKPVPTSSVALSANLPPGGGSPPAPISSTVSVYDSQGQAHQLTLNFAPAAGTPNAWTLTVTDDKSPANTIGTASLAFAADGTLQTVTQGGSTAAGAGASASVTLNTAYPAAGGGTQAISLGIGTIGGTTGLTQFAGTAYTLNSLSQNGVPPGAFSSVTTTSAGDIIVNFNNGQSRTIARVPVVTFPAPDALQRQNGQAFTATVASGDPLAHDAGTGGAGGLVTSSVEASNVDISSEFTKLIVAQQAYSANAKLVTTASQLLQTTIDMKQ